MVEAAKRSELTALQRPALERLEACACEGLTIQAFAGRRRLSEQKLYQVAKVLRRMGVLPPASRGASKPLRTRRQTALKPQGWMTFLRNHKDAIAGTDFFVVPIVRFR